jgi:hypothetical protein
VPKVDFSSDARTATVSVNGRPAVYFRTSNGSLTPADRAKLTAERLKPLADGGWTSLVVKTTGKRTEVRAGEQLICIATEADARKVGMTREALASRWVSNLRTLFAMPPLSITPTEITVPENESRTITVGGALTSRLSVADGDSSIALSAVNHARRAVVVKGKTVGKCLVDVCCEGYKATLVVNVRRYAGKVSRTERVEVTGNPAPEWVLERAASLRAPSAIRVEPGANVSYGKPRVAVNALKPGTCIKATVPVKVSGPGLIPVTLNAPVNVCNKEVPRKPVQGLFYSNNPESVKECGTLFTGLFTPRERARLLYHHQNATGSKMRFAIEIINPGSTTASLHAVSGVTEPIVDTVVVGYLAGQRFVRDYLSNVGQIYEIPAMSRMVLYTDMVGVMQTVSGIIDMQQLSGESLYLRVRADEPGTYLANGMVMDLSPSAIPNKLSEEVYPTPTKQVTATYTVGDKWAFIRVGKNAITDAEQKRKLYGNYGVMYNIDVNLSNPSGDAKTIKVLFEPTAGPASGIFLINGQIIGAKFVTPPTEFEVTSIRLQPGESKQVRITTIPLAGSAYPATIIVRS